MNLYKSDLIRRGGKTRVPAFQKWLRLAQSDFPYLIKLLFRIVYHFSLSKIYRHIEISTYTNIGQGLYIGHPFDITINQNAVIGNNCNIHRGVLIGQENRGRREGAPIIGNRVWIGVNASVVGNVTIGDDVLIAPNSFVNCDIPSHSIVFGNPCQIKYRENATDGYINNAI